MNGLPVGTVRHDDRRFVAATVAVPVALMLVVGPVFSAASRLSGHGVTDGAAAVSPFGFAAVAVGWIAAVAALAGIVVGSLGGRAAAHALLALEDLPTVVTPAPPTPFATRFLGAPRP